ncbi:MAG: branched-chain amino acid transporter permease [Ilumatobacteraceae bacterium]|nr:branched-chain amino acid transporter permease [Ilumatobacteraceae bacterium]
MSAHIVSGVVNGALYALLAVGIVLVYQITGVLNFAFGAFGMIACYSFSSLGQHVNPWVAFAIVGIGALVAGLVIGVLTLPAQASSPLVKAVATLGLVSALQGFVALVWGTDIRGIPVLWRTRAFIVFGIAVSWQRVLSVVFAIGLSIVAYAFFKRGTVGAALRAIASNTRTSQLIGLPIERLWILAWSISTGVAAFAAMMLLPEVGLDPGAQTFIILVPISAALVARFRSVPIAFFTALAIGIGGNIMQGIDSLAIYRDALPLAVVIVGLSFARTNRVYERV